MPTRRRKPPVKISGRKITDREYGLPDARFPFVARCASEEDFVRSESNLVILGVEDMIYQVIRGTSNRPLQDEEVDELAQRIRCKMWERFLPRFDREKATRLTTYLYECFRNETIAQLRKLGRRNIAGTRVDIEFHSDVHDLAYNRHGNDEAVDLRVERLARDVMLRPEKYMSAKQAQVLRKMLAVNGQAVSTRMVDEYKRLGFNAANSLSMLISRICIKLSERGVDDGPVEE